MWEDIEKVTSELNKLMSAITRDTSTVGEDIIFHGTIMSKEDLMNLRIDLEAAKRLLTDGSKIIQEYLRNEISTR